MRPFQEGCGLRVTQPRAPRHGAEAGLQGPSNGFTVTPLRVDADDLAELGLSPPAELHALAELHEVREAGEPAGARAISVTMPPILSSGCAAKPPAMARSNPSKGCRGRGAGPCRLGRGSGSSGVRQLVAPRVLIASSRDDSEVLERGRHRIEGARDRDQLAHLQHRIDVGALDVALLHADLAELQHAELPADPG